MNTLSLPALAFLLFAPLNFLYAQTERENTIGYDYNLYDSEGIREMDQKAREMNLTSEEFKVYKSAKTNLTVFGILLGVGTALVATPVGRHLAGKEVNWNVARVGGGVALLSFPFAAQSMSLSKKVDLMREERLRRQAASGFRPELYLSARQNGLGLILKF